jgi:hypothetical protein
LTISGGLISIFYLGDYGLDILSNHSLIEGASETFFISDYGVIKELVISFY